MDASEMRELLQGYLSEVDWNGGATKDDLIAHLAGRDEALRTMLNQYVAEGTYADVDAVLTVIPAQAWQDVQGDAWRGAASLDPAHAPSGFAASAVGRNASDVHHAGGAPSGASPPDRLVPVALSALAEGLGQAYNRQPAKAAVLLLLGLGLSTASGLNTWLVRRLFRAENVTIGAERVRPPLLGLWAATYAFNLWDAWSAASRRNTDRGPASR